MSHINLLDINTEELFINHTIKEIQDVQKKIQSEIDKKRQELRSMVGERYRDVLTAADTIRLMHGSAESLRNQIHSIHTKCYEIQAKEQDVQQKLQPTDKFKDYLRSIAIQIRILILIPETIWTCLDETDYLKAVQIYLLAIHIHTGLELNTSQKVLEKFPILSKLKLSINLFRKRILDGIKIRLKTTTIQSDEASSHLCAYILLESKTQESALQLLVQLRQECLQDLLKGDVNLHSDVRNRILNLIRCLMCTIDLLHSCFIGNENHRKNLVEDRLKIVLDNSVGLSILPDLGLGLDRNATPLLDYVPDIVNKFRPTCLAYNIELSKDILQQVINDWLVTTQNVLTTQLSTSLEAVTSVKALHGIREEALKIEPPNDWLLLTDDSICFSKDFDVWRKLFQPLISKRAEELVKRRINGNLLKILETITSELKECEEMEKDLRWYVWNESPDDIGKDAGNHEGLRMKTKGFCSRIVEMCRTLDRTYLELLQDVSLYLQAGAELSKASNLRLYLRDESIASIDRLMTHVEKCIGNKNVTIKCALVGGRLLEAVSYLCPNLKSCCCSENEDKNDNKQWGELLERIERKGLEFWEQWLTSETKRMKTLATQFITIDIKPSLILNTLPKWDVIEIEEQIEDRTIKSDIRLPTQPSISLLGLLSSILSELDTAVPHTVPKIIHERFVYNLVDVIFEQYEIITTKDITQNLSIQLLLDIKFITTLCVKRDCKILLDRSHQISDGLRSKIDPFDLNVFYPHLQGCIKRSVLQTHVLLGCLLGSSGQLSNLGVSESTTERDRDPSVLSVSLPSNELWFPLLPVTAPTSKIVATNTQPPVIKTEIRPQPSIKHSSTTSSVRSGAAALLADWFS